MSTGIGDKRLLVWRTFLKAHSTIIKALERELEEDQHLPLSWFDVLGWLSRAPDGRLQMKVLADSIYLSNSGLTRLLDRMTAAGLVERQIKPDDRRGWYAVITPKGREILERAIPGHARGVGRHFFGRLSDDEIEVLYSLLSRLAEPAEKIRRDVQIR